MARILVAADYQMKRYAMDLETPPVRGLPSFLDLLKSKRGSTANMNPRWWMACNYDPMARSDDGLASLAGMAGLLFPWNLSCEKIRGFLDIERSRFAS